MRLPDSDGHVSGTYLYAKYRKDIPLSGMRKGDTLFLTEGEPGKVTGEFRLEHRSYLNDYDEHWKGAWNKPGREPSLPVRLFPTWAGSKACHLADPDSLTMAEGQSFAMEMASHLPTGEDPDARPSPSLDGPLESIFYVTACSGGLMTAAFTWFHNPGFDPTMRQTQLQWTFDLARKREIRMWREIDSTKTREFTLFLSESLIPRLSEIHQILTEDKRNGVHSNEIREVSSAADDLGTLEVRIEEGKVMIGWMNYFDFSLRQICMTNTTGEAWIEMSPEDLRTFLRKDSALRNLISKQ